MDLVIVHHDGEREQVKVGEDFDFRELNQAIVDPEVTHITVGDNLYHKGTIKKVVKADSVVE